MERQSICGNIREGTLPDHTMSIGEAKNLIDSGGTKLVPQQ
jgi:hypothetical protein